MVTRAIERSQQQVESQNFSVRKHLLEYDDVMNKQRESVYTLRREVLNGKVHLTEDEVVDMRGYLLALAEDILEDTVDKYAGKTLDVEEWNIESLRRETSRIFSIKQADLTDIIADEYSSDEITDSAWSTIKAAYKKKEDLLGAEIVRKLERDISLQIIDTQWKDHLYSLDHLKEGIGLRGYGQRDPLVEYKKESFKLFQDMKGRVEEEIVRYLFGVRLAEGDDASNPSSVKRKAEQLTMNHPDADPGLNRSAPSPRFSNSQNLKPARSGGDDVIKTVRNKGPKVGRNEPCPCGSGKKYKKCHGGATA
jgi:preprotein translocase subunit SecA